MIIDTKKITDQAKANLKSTKGKAVAGVGAAALAALIAIPAFAHEGFGERGGHGKDHRGGHEQMSRDGHGFDLTFVQVAGLQMTLPEAVKVAEVATNGRALDAEIEMGKNGVVLVDVHLMLADGTANHVVVNTADGSVMEATLKGRADTAPDADAAASDEG